MTNNHIYDVVIIGGGHNGLVASCYLAMAGLRVVILEKNDTIGGATCSRKVFPGVDANLSVYSYLVSLFPKKIINELNLRFVTRSRSIASYTPVECDGISKGLLISNTSEDETRASFGLITRSEQEHFRYRELQRKLSVFAARVWPTLLSPMPSRNELMKEFKSKEERGIWNSLIEEPLSTFIEDHLSDDTVRGAVFTDAKIGIPTFPEDPSLKQNKTFIYHVIGQGTGEWNVPVGGMGALVEALINRAVKLGVDMIPCANVRGVDHALPRSTVHYILDQKEMAIDTSYVLFNASSVIANQCLPGVLQEDLIDGSVFKINMVVRKLPTLKDAPISAQKAFTGTFHLNEGYEHMKTTYRNALEGFVMDRLPGEMYCHSLTDLSILSLDLQNQGYQTLTLFGLDVPYHWFINDNEGMKAKVTKNYIQSISSFIKEDFLDCLAIDANGNPCIEAKSPVDLENSLGLPRGNIFHGCLTWPFAEDDDGSGMWGVETNYEKIFFCGSSAKRGGAVSGIPGHNAAMKILGRMS